MKRREFIAVLGGAAAAWPFAARAQQQPKMLRLGFVGIQPRASPPSAFSIKVHLKHTRNSRRHSAKGLGKPATWTDVMFSSNIVGRTAKAIGYRNWRPIW
jgi:hypothetical protein